MKITNKNILQLRDGSIRTHSPIGGYPLFYVTKLNEVLSPESVEDCIELCCDKNSELYITHACCNFDNANLACSYSGRLIDYAYNKT